MAKNLVYDIHDKPKFGNMLIFALQQVLAILAATILVLAATYPLFGFVRRRVTGSLVEERQQVVAALEMEGYTLAGESAEGLLFRGNVVKRLTSLFEDEIVVRQANDDELEIVGLRRAVVRVAIRMEGYIINNRRVKNG